MGGELRLHKYTADSANKKVEELIESGVRPLVVKPRLTRLHSSRRASRGGGGRGPRAPPKKRGRGGRPPPPAPGGPRA